MSWAGKAKVMKYLIDHADGIAELKMFLVDEDALEIMARAHDAEECSQKGEPSPWRDDLVAQYKREEGEAAWMEWRSERLAAMRAAVQAVMP